ncbi:MAG: tetratricopeptide repeat protein, partial [Calditrichales bacterium]
MKCIVLFLHIFFVVICANAQQQVVRLSAEREAWLAGDRQSALDLLLKQEAAGDQNTTTLYNIGYLYSLKGDYTKALTYFQTVVVKQPSFPYAYLQIARIHISVGNLHAAHENLRKGLEKDSDNIDLLLEMSGVLHSLGMTDKEAVVYEDILNLDEDNVPAIVGSSRILRNKGETGEARKILENNPTIYPEALILYEKARVYRKLGQVETSRDFLVNILKDYPNSARWASIRDTLLEKYEMAQIPEADRLPTYTYKIDPGEKLDYKVSYGFISLGWLKVRFAKPVMVQGKQVYPIHF